MRNWREELGLDTEALASAEGVEILAGNRVAAGSEPLAQAYAGHQFGHFVPQLGDGRANLLGEVVGLDGVRYDVQLSAALRFVAPATDAASSAGLRMTGVYMTRWL